MRVAIRGKEVVVPDLTGKTEAEARQILEKNGLTLKVSQTRFVPGVPEGRIVEQNPPKGTSLKTGRSVKVLVSLGRTKIPGSQTSRWKRARSSDHTLGKQTEPWHYRFAHTNEGDPSTVVYQSPPPETVNGADPKVNIMVSLGPAGTVLHDAGPGRQAVRFGVRSRPCRGIQDSVSRIIASIRELLRVW